MTVREYITQKLQAFSLTEATMSDIMLSMGGSLDEEYTLDMAAPVGKAMASALAELILAPRLSSINESGFSMSWDYSDLGKYYLYLCNKWGVPVNDDVLTASGISSIIDRSDFW